MNTVKLNKITFAAIGAFIAISLPIAIEVAQSESAYSNAWSQQAIMPEFRLRNVGERPMLADYSDRAQLARANFRPSPEPTKAAIEKPEVSFGDSSIAQIPQTNTRGESISTDKISALIDEVNLKAARR